MTKILKRKFVISSNDNDSLLLKQFFFYFTKKKKKEKRNYILSTNTNLSLHYFPKDITLHD